MSWMGGLRATLHQLWRRADADARMDEELRFHVEMETEKNLRLGLSPAEARRRALVAFGGVEQHRDAMREDRRVPVLEGLARDLRKAVRSRRATMPPCTSSHAVRCHPPRSRRPCGPRYGPRIRPSL